MKIKIETPKARSFTTVAMNARHSGRQVMKDRRQVRGGSRNKQNDYRNGNY